ncbi:glycosyltransferase family 39 protein [Coraliomargarita sp. SDUM461004]|uniref:Glycosyltransferase family 39 protein n=1 Tax=Thalassobacterium sedimentorum TaxID=3041258 RepID=A0ABU1AKE9_9BACT|nr:glycosyltransferase family 39 protein [Coraliomargarita sp. SDUM461004]MDQ8194320.1 glycosyltransferase family 39 protein [Coraliomargarita sp. SDUM461004]
MRHRCILLFLASLLAIYFGFFYFDVERAFLVVGWSGYWFILLAFLLAIASWWQVVSGGVPIGERLAALRQKKLRVYCPVLAVLLTWMYVLNAQPAEFKIHMDEPVLAATAKQMHVDRSCFYFTAGYNVQNMYYPNSGAVDKRPLLFPFLVSLLHDTTGYRVENSIYLNAIVLLLFLATGFYLGGRLLPSLGGYLTLVLLATLPLLSVVANSGGFDLLNTTMIGLTTVAMLKYIESPSLKHQALYIASTILLVQSRYESAVFVLPVAIGVLWHWWHVRRIEISIALILAPLLLVPFGLQRVMMREYSSFWQMQDGRSEPFSLSYLGDNLQHAGMYLFSMSGELPNSFLLSVLSALAFLCLVWSFFSGRWASCFNHPVKSRMAMVVVALILFNFGLLMVYHWAHLDDMVVTRIALPFLCLQVVVVLAVFRIWIPRGGGLKPQGGILVLCVLYFLVVSRPAIARNEYLDEIESESLCDRVLKLGDDLKGQPLQGNPLLISQVSIVGVLSNISSISVITAQRQLPELELHMHLKTFDDVFVLYLVGEGAFEANFKREGKTLSYERIENCFKLTVLEEQMTPTGKLLRLARVEGIRREALPASNLLRPDWGDVQVDYTGRMSEEAIKNRLFVETLPKLL